MKISDLFRFSTDNLRRRKGRTVLTIIGVVVGVCAIVVMISLGIAVNKATDEMLQSWGDLTKITVNSFGAQQGTPDLDDKMVETFRSLDHVTAATPMYSPQSFSGELRAGKNGRYQGWGQIIGMDPDAIGPMGYRLITGNYIKDDMHYGKTKIPVLVEAQAVFNFFDTKKNPNSPSYAKYPEYDEKDWSKPKNLPKYDENGVLLNPEDAFFDLMDTKLVFRLQYDYDENTGEPKYKEYELVVVGVIEADSNEYEIMGNVVMSIENIKKLEADYRKLSKTGGQRSSGGGNIYGGSGEGMVNVGGYSSVFVKVDSVDNMQAVEKAIKEIGYQIYSMSEERARLQGQVAQTQLMLGGLAAVSLFVAALNIMNTMTMAIYERTKEIGVMKVLGCKLSNIRQMFLIESGTIGLIGGIAGVLLSVLISAALNYLPGLLTQLGVQGNFDIAAMFGLSGLSDSMGGMQMSVIPPWLVIMALLFATMVGLLSGIAPANRAVKISSLEAIRHE